VGVLYHRAAIRPSTDPGKEKPPGNFT